MGWTATAQVSTGNLRWVGLAGALVGIVGISRGLDTAVAVALALVAMEADGWTMKSTGRTSDRDMNVTMPRGSRPPGSCTS